MDAKFSPNTFAKDHIVRNELGKPFGRVILPEDFTYTPGIESIPVLIFKIPKVISESPLSAIFYIDGYKYAIPKDVHSFRVNLRGPDWVVASFHLRRVSNEAS